MFAHAIQREMVSETQHHSLWTHSRWNDTLVHVSNSTAVCSLWIQIWLPRTCSLDLTVHVTHQQKQVKDIFLRLNVPLERLHTCLYVWMMSKRKWKRPGCLYVHCSNHALDLVLQKAARELRLAANTLHFVQGVCCHQRHIQTQNFVPVSSGSEQVVCNLLRLCPTHQSLPHMRHIWRSWKHRAW